MDYLNFIKHFLMSGLFNIDKFLDKVWIIFYSIIYNSYSDIRKSAEAFMEVVGCLAGTAVHCPIFSLFQNARIPEDE